MKLFYIATFNENRQLISQASSLPFFASYYQKTLENIILFVIDKVLHSIQNESSENVDNFKISATEKDYTIHLEKHGDNPIVALVSDPQYPQKVAHRVINLVYKELLHESNTNFNDFLKHLLHTYQDPNSDQLFQFEKELEEVRDIVSNTVDKLLQRGEKLDVLVEKTALLSESSKSFYKRSKKTNRWCPFWWPSFY